MRRAALALVALAPLLACNAITGLSDDYALDLTDGGGPGADGSADAGGDRTGDGSGQLGCGSGDPSIVFCDDFDTPRDGTALGWDREESNGGTIEVADAVGSGGTRGLRARLEFSGGSRKVALWKEILGAFSALTLRFKFSVVAKSTSYFVIGAFGFAQPGNYRSYGLAAHDGDRVDQSDPPSPANADALLFTPRKFYDAEVVVERSGSRYSSRLTVGGSVVDERDDANLGDTTPTKIEIGVGAFFTSVGGEGEVIVDDVMVTRR